MWYDLHSIKSKKCLGFKFKIYTDLFNKSFNKNMIFSKRNKLSCMFKKHKYYYYLGIVSRYLYKL